MSNPLIIQNPNTILSFDPNILGAGRMLAGVVFNNAVVLDKPFTGYGRWLSCDGEGDVTYMQYDGTTAVFTNMVTGFWHPIFAIEVFSVGTGATGLRWGN